MTGEGSAVAPVTSIRSLTARDADALLEFERANREWFGSLVPDRGDAYFEDFPTRHQSLLDEQREGTARFWLVVDEHDVLVGRVNLVDIAAGCATLGYRIGREHAGRGHAKRSVALVLRQAAALGVERVSASTTIDNVASQRVLAASGFLPAAGGPDTLDVNGRPRAALHVTRRL